METTNLYLGIAGDSPVAYRVTTTPGSYAGHITVGSEKLVNWLELHLGLSGIFPSFNERAIQLITLIREQKDESFFFRDSFRADPLGVAKRLLILRDSWIYSGWDGKFSKKLPARMETIAGMKTVFEKCGLGLPERILQVTEHLAATKIPQLEIHLVDPPELFPCIIQQLLQKLDKQVYHDYEKIKPQAPSHTDLGKLQLALYHGSSDQSFQNDHSLQVMYFDNDTAEANAVYAIQRATQWNPVIVNPDSSLLNGIHVSQNHPVSRWQTIAGNGQVSQLFFLATALFRRPVNTSQVISFLSAAHSPVPKRLAKRLVEIFSERPGFGNLEWNQAIEEYKVSVRGEKNEKAVIQSINFWLGMHQQQHLTEPGFSTAVIEDIYTKLGAWARERMHLDHYTLYAGQLSNLVTLCRLLVQALQNEDDIIPVAKFERLQSELFAEGRNTIAEAEIGSADSFVQPGSIWGPCSEILWMNAIRNEPAGYLTRYWYQEEKRYFGTEGLPIHDEKHAIAVENYALKRMMLSSKSRVVITIPRVSAGTPTGKPYCLEEWNKLIPLQPVSLEAGALLEKLPWSGTALVQEYSPIMLPTPARYLTIGKEGFQRDKESYSSIEKLIQHPALWYMEYRLNLRYRAGIAVPGQSVIKGVIADRVIQELFKEANKKSAWWKSEPLFKVEVERTCNLMLDQEGLPFLETHTRRLLMEYKQALVNALTNLKRFIDKNKLKIIATQYTVSGQIDNTPCEGFIDLLVEFNGKKLVIDLKWAGSSHRYTEKLYTGTDLQLVLYARLLGEGTGSGYFMLNDATTYMRAEKINEGLEFVRYVQAADGVNTDIAYQRALNGLRFRRTELAAGRAEAGYNEPIEELDYFRETDAANLYPLAARGNDKAKPFDDDYALFFGQII